MFILEFTELECRNETGRTKIGKDEVYVVFLAADTSPVTVALAVTTTRVFKNLDKGDIRSQPVPLWGFNGEAAEIRDRPGHPNADDLIFLVSVMEHDRSGFRTVKNMVQTTLFAPLMGYKAAGLRHDLLVERLKDNMHSALALGARATRPIGNQDDRIGRPQEVPLTMMMDAIASGENPVETQLEHRGQRARYLTRFVLRRA